MAQNRPATQDFVSVRDIRGNIVIQKNGQLCMVLLATSINFALKSIDEQEAILQQFQQFLNTIDFSLQIYIQSRRLNINPYLALLANLESKQDGELMRIQLREYMEFIRTFTKNVDVMSKNFFVVVPYSPAKINISTGFANMLSQRNATKTIRKNGVQEDEFEEHRVQLEQRTSLVAEGLSRVGIRTIALQKDDLVDFYYHVYNPADITGSALPLSKPTDK